MQVHSWCGGRQGVPLWYGRSYKVSLHSYSDYTSYLLYYQCQYLAHVLSKGDITLALTGCLNTVLLVVVNLHFVMVVVTRHIITYVWGYCDFNNASRKYLPSMSSFYRQLYLCYLSPKYVIVRLLLGRCYIELRLYSLDPSNKEPVCHQSRLVFESCSINA